MRHRSAHLDSDDTGAVMDKIIPFCRYLRRFSRSREEELLVDEEWHAAETGPEPEVVEVHRNRMSPTVALDTGNCRHDGAPEIQRSLGVHGRGASGETEPAE